MMQMEDFFSHINMAMTVCDKKGIVLYMNEKAKTTFSKWGGGDLIGKSLMSCHNEQSQKKIEELIEKGTSNTYTVEKMGIKKLIHQTPWFDKGELAGLIEYSIELPAQLPHFIRN